MTTYSFHCFLNNSVLPHTARKMKASLLLFILFQLLATQAFLLMRNSRATTLSCFRIFLSKKSTSATANSEKIQRAATVPIELKDELKNSFMSYAMSTILGRALPDIRDGLKPVHRRVIYGMHALNLVPDGGFRKSARIVGEVLGKFHPHGDQSVYDALVRMAQNFAMLHPLVNGHGNFGSVDNDPAAAMRYTEAKLSPIGYDTLLSDIKENTTDFVPNFDGNEKEPAILPSKLPLLLLNGATGIAVGMATNIPSHNLGELCDAVSAVIDNPKIGDKELLSIVPAPDFPTGGLIMGRAGAENLYTTGRGSITLRAKTMIENIGAGRSGKTKHLAIVVTELPFMTNKAALVSTIAEMVNQKRLEGISDIRDESDRNGIRVVIELKKDAIPAVVQNNLFKKTPLQTSFPGNMLAVVNEGKQPQRFTLKEALSSFLNFRFSTIMRRTAFRKAKVADRMHIVEGLVIALKDVDKCITAIRQSKDSAEAKSRLMSKDFKLSNEQSEAILSLKLSRLTTLETQKLEQEYNELKKSLTELNSVLGDEKKVFNLIKTELAEMKSKYGIPRRSMVVEEEGSLKEEDLISNDHSIVVVTKSGYIKRVAAEDFESQARGGRGKAGAKMSSTDDEVQHFFSCQNHDSLLFISERGKAYSVKAYKIPLCSRTAKGSPAPQILPIAASDQISSVMPLSSKEGGDELVLLTRKGLIKKTKLSAFKNLNQRGLRIINLKPDDSLGWIRRSDKSDGLAIITRNGYLARFSAEDLIPKGRKSGGIRSLKLRNDDQIAAMDVFATKRAGTVSPPNFVAIVTEKGFGKRVKLTSFPLRNRGRTLGAQAIRFKPTASNMSKAGSDGVCALRACCDEGDLVMSTMKGVVVRQPVKKLTEQSRKGTGVRIQRLLEDDRVAMVDIVPTSTNLANASKEFPNDNEITNEEFLVEEDAEEIEIGDEMEEE